MSEHIKTGEEILETLQHGIEICHSRVSVPWDAEIFIQWLEKRVKEG